MNRLPTGKATDHTNQELRRRLPLLLSKAEHPLWVVRREPHLAVRRYYTGLQSKIVSSIYDLCTYAT